MTEEVQKLDEAVHDLDKRITTLETKEPLLHQMLERSISTNEELTKTMHDVQITMVKLTDQMDNQSKAIEAQSKALEDMKQDFESATAKTNEKISAMDKRVDAVEDKGKFDIFDYLKKNFPWIVIVLGVGIAYASQYFKV